MEKYEKMTYGDLMATVEKIKVVLQMKAETYTFIKQKNEAMYEWSQIGKYLNKLMRELDPIKA